MTLSTPKFAYHNTSTLGETINFIASFPSEVAETPVGFNHTTVFFLVLSLFFNERTGLHKKISSTFDKLPAKLLQFPRSSDFKKFGKVCYSSNSDALAARWASKNPLNAMEAWISRLISAPVAATGAGVQSAPPDWTNPVGDAPTGGKRPATCRLVPQSASPSAFWVDVGEPLDVDRWVDVERAARRRPTGCRRQSEPLRSSTDWVDVDGRSTSADVVDVEQAARQALLNAAQLPATNLEPKDGKGNTSLKARVRASGKPTRILPRTNLPFGRQLHSLGQYPNSTKFRRDAIAYFVIAMGLSQGTKGMQQTLYHILQNASLRIGNGSYHSARRAGTPGPEPFKEASGGSSSSRGQAQ
nr:hypothetical protein Iba_chr10bCG8920 [Ipomoea batatas]